MRTEGEHLQEGRLGLVRRILGATFTLSDPEALTLLDGIMHIFGEETSSEKDFPSLEVTPDEEASIELDKRLDPRVEHQVVPDGYLWELRPGISEEDVEEG